MRLLSVAPLLAALLCASGAAEAATVTVAWNPSPDATVVGYRVFVGPTSRFYTQAFDVGGATVFSFDAAEGAQYYFAVAAYAPGPLVGPPSTEVAVAVGADGSVTEFDPPGTYWSSAWRQTFTASTQSRRTPCSDPGNSDCATVHALAAAHEPVTSMAAAGDGRLFYVEGQRRVRVITPTGLEAQSAVVSGTPGITLNQVAIDPSFDDTGFLWVSETARLRDGRRQFTVARYRLAGNVAIERVPVVSSVPLPASGDALFAIEPGGGIYIAVPSSRLRSAGAYEGKVLRFSADGTVPADNPNRSPVWMTGYSVPTGIAADAARGRIWLSGTDQRALRRTSAVALDGQLRPRTLLSELRSDLSFVYRLDGRYLLSLTSNGTIERAKLTAADAVMERDTLHFAIPGRIRAITSGPRGQVFAAIQLRAPSANTFAIVQILSGP